MFVNMITLIEAKETTFNTISQSDIDEMQIGDLIYCKDNVPKKLRTFIADQDPKNFIIQKKGDDYLILRTDNKKHSTSSFKKLKTGEFIDFKDDCQKMVVYAHVYGRSSNKKFKSETFKSPDQGKFTRVTRLA